MKPNFVNFCRTYKAEHHGSSLLEAKLAYEAKHGVKLSDRQAVANLLDACRKVSAYRGQEHVDQMNLRMEDVRLHFGL